MGYPFNYLFSKERTISGTILKKIGCQKTIIFISRWVDPVGKQVSGGEDLLILAFSTEPFKNVIFLNILDNIRELYILLLSKWARLKTSSHRHSLIAVHLGCCCQTVKSSLWVHCIKLQKKVKTSFSNGPDRQSPIILYAYKVL